MPTPLLFQRATMSAVLYAAVAVHAADAERPHLTPKPTQAAAVRLEVAGHAHYRAIFCGADGTETGAVYSRALARDLERLERSGRSIAQSLAHIKARACDTRRSQ